MKKLIIISNDKIYFDNKFVRTDFNDTLNIIEVYQKKIIYIFFQEKVNLKEFIRLKLKKNTIKNIRYQIFKLTKYKNFYDFYYTL